VSPPFWVGDGDASYRPDLVLWVEEPSGLIVGQELVLPGEEEGAVARILLAALKRPVTGAPRRPDLLRVADAALAAEVRGAIGDTIPVTVVPTPELDAVLEAIVDHAPGPEEETSYLAGGQIAPAVVGELFTAAERLYHTAPWKAATDGQVVRVDIPALGVVGGCISIIGHLGESLGLLLFPSLDGYEACVRAAEGGLPQSGPIDLGTGWLSLSFTPEAELPEALRREAADHGWPIADGDAYPVVERRDPDAAVAPLAERD